MAKRKDYYQRYGRKYYEKYRDKMIAAAKVRSMRRKARIRQELAEAAGINLDDKIPIIEGARMLGVPYSTLYYWISNGLIPVPFHFTPGGRRFLYRSEIENLTQRKTNVYQSKQQNHDRR
jgi:hypothetical protein